jgi:uncharacterized protein YdeI (YjbR/CyaY-like superfamily)
MKPTFFHSASDFREWLTLNHDKFPEFWVGFYKKKSGKAGISYQEAVDEALCFGWIDGLKKAVDEISYAHRFTPRKSKSFWSAVNIRRVAELERRGRMRAPGLKAFARRDEKKAKQYSYERSTCKWRARRRNGFEGTRRRGRFFRPNLLVIDEPRLGG